MIWWRRSLSEESVLNDLKDLKSKNLDLKWNAANNLRKFLMSNPTDFRYRMIVKSFLSMVYDPNEKIREIAITTLLDVVPDPQKLEPLLISALKDTSPGIRSLALENLGKYNHNNLKTYTLNGLHDESDVVKKTALEIVVKYQFQGVENELLQLLDSEKGGLRRTVIYALGKLKTAQAINTLIRIMRNPDFDDLTRNQAGSALEHMGGKEIIAPFIENLAESNDYVRESASAFLKSKESEVYSVISSSGRLDYIGLLQYGTESTKQNFDVIVDRLQDHLSFAIQDLRVKLSRQDEIDIQELASNFYTTTFAVKILIEKILKLWILEISEDKYITENGLIKLLIKELYDEKLIIFENLQKKDPFQQVPPDFLKQKLISIQEIQYIEPGIYLNKELFLKYSSELKTIGIFDISLLAEELNQEIGFLKKNIVPALDQTTKGWYNSKNQYFTFNYLKSHIKDYIQQYKAISIENYLKKIGNPSIDPNLIKEIIRENFEGKWLSDINVFIEMTEYQKIAENSIRIDEERLNHLIASIGIEFPIFLQNLQKVLDIKTFKTKSDQLVSLESLTPLLEQKILEKGFLNITKLMAELKLDISVKSIILEYLTQKFSGKSNLSKTYFFTENLLNKVKLEIEKLQRFNYNVLSFKIEVPTDILHIIIEEVLLIRGIKSSLGEFITLKGIEKELQDILSHKEEFSIQELYEILEIEKEKETIGIIRDIIIQNNLWMSRDASLVLTHKRAFGKVLTFLKNPSNKSKGRISWNEISLETNVSEENIKPILESLIQNNLLVGRLDKKGFQS